MLQRSRMLGFAAACALLVPAVHASAQTMTPTRVRITAKQARVVDTPLITALVVEVVPNGTDVDVLLENDGWYWVVLPRDGYGTRRGGWLRVRDVDAIEDDGTFAKSSKAGKRQARLAAIEAKREERAAKHAQQVAARNAKNEAKREAKNQPAAEKQAGANAAAGESPRLKKAQQDLEKARADYDAAVKRREASASGAAKQ